MTRLYNKKGFTIIQHIVIIVVIGIIVGIAVPKFMEAQNRAKIDVAESDLNTIRQALTRYVGDHSSYVLGTIDSYADFVAALVDPNGDPYMVLPDTTNFTNFSFTGNGTTYTITLDARDNASTTLTGTPRGITK